jgi:hypothetical protein
MLDDADADTDASGGDMRAVAWASIGKALSNAMCAYGFNTDMYLCDEREGAVRRLMWSHRSRTLRTEHAG